MNRLLIVAALAACSNHSEPPAPTPKAVQPAVAAPSQHVASRTFHSEALGVDKTYVVYLPAEYDAKPTARWPVLYYLHGLTGDENSWIKGGHIDEIADKLHLGAIIVMPDGDDGFYADSDRAIDYDLCMQDGTGLFLPTRQPHARTCVRHHKYETYIIKDLVGDVDAHYRTIAAREGRGLAGMSMGGLGALELAMRHVDQFAAAASHSGVDALLYEGPRPYPAGHPEKVQLTSDVKNWGRAVGEIGAWVRGIYGGDPDTWKAYDPATLVSTLLPGKLALYLDCGTEDDFALQDGAAYVHDLLLARKIDHVFFLGPGHHDFKFWIPRLPESLGFLRDHLAKPAEGPADPRQPAATAR